MMVWNKVGMHGQMKNCLVMTVSVDEIWSVIWSNERVLKKEKDGDLIYQLNMHKILWSGWYYEEHSDGAVNFTVPSALEFRLKITLGKDFPLTCIHLTETFQGI